MDHASHGHEQGKAATQEHASHAAALGEAPAAHDKHAGHSVEMFRRRFWGTLALTVPTVGWSPSTEQWLHYQAPEFPGSSWIPAIFGTAVFAYGGLIFLRGAAGELRARKPGMMTLIALAITAAFAFSLAVTLGASGMALWWELATLITIMVLGHWIEMRSIASAEGALHELAKLLPAVAVRVRGDALEEVPLAELRDGDLVLVRPGASVPADGQVREGASTVDESMITGESRAIPKQAGDKVIAGTVNGAGSLRVAVTGTGERTALAGIMRLVAHAQASRSQVQVLADRAAFLLTVIAILAGALTLVAWLMLRAPAGFAVERMVTVLVIACPHALGLAVPLVVAISTTLAARAGLLVRDRRGLEEARRVDTVMFDKTGTLTMAQLRVVETVTAAGTSADDALRLAASVERDSEHPVARAIVRSAEERKLPIPTSREFASLPGRGARATVEGRVLSVGGPALLSASKIEPTPDLRAAEVRAAHQGHAAIWLVDGTRALAVFAVADAIRPEARAAIAQLHAARVRVMMVTGDARVVAESVAKELGIDRVAAEVLPSQKVEEVKAVQRAGHRVAMVGDGVNDAPALLTADVGVAIGAGTEVAVEAGDIVLVRSDPRDVPRIITLSRATYRKMLQNLWWAAGYNIIAIPLAAGVLASWGIVLQPAAGAILMSASTVIVALNSQLLRRVTL